MVDGPVLAVIGTGSLARAFCYSFAVVHPGSVRVVVLGRVAGAAAELCHVASTTAAAGGRGAVRFEPVVADGFGLADALAAWSPAGVLVCASTQSPWERFAGPSAWTALVERAGYGVTLPFQAELALVAGSAVAGGGWLVNACYPDAVNPVLAARGVPVLCGVGNVGLLAASLQAALGLADQSRLRVLGHHAHLHQPARAQDEALAWCDDEPVGEVGTLLAGQRAAGRRELNQVTGLTAALVVSALLTGEVLETSLPGPLGLPGGYPVCLNALDSTGRPDRGRADAAPMAGGPPDVAGHHPGHHTGHHAGRLELRLPAGLSEAEAVARNQRWAVADGAVVAGGRVALSERAGEALRAVAPELAGGFAVADLDAVTRRLHDLRDRLRGDPRPHSTEPFEQRTTT